MKKRIIIPVGISLLENARKIKQGQLLRLIMNEENQSERVALKEELENLDSLSLSSLTESDPKVMGTLFQMNSKDISAETHSLKQLFDDDDVEIDPTKDDLEVFLLGTAAAQGNEGSILCAQKLREYIHGEWGIEAECPPEISGEIHGKTSFKKSLLELMTKLEELLERGEVDRTYVVITGGYKGFIPWVSLVTSLYETAYLVYVHKDSEECLFWPGLYVQWDLRRLDEIRSVVRRRTTIEESERKALSDSARYLYDRVEGTPDFKLNALGLMIQRFFKSNRLLRYGYGRPLLLRLKERSSDLYQIIDERLPYWEHLWIGDQIPETVEHSRLHSLRLMEFTYFLLQFFPDLEEKLGAKGLFYLIASLWLHDIGHGALEFDGQPIGMMPSLVRDHHNLTSAKIIRHEPGFQVLADEALLPEQYRDAVALIAEYNRRKQPLTSEQKADLEKADLEEEAKAEALSTTFPKPLEEKSSELLLATALLGLIDGLDVQADRVVTSEYERMREQRNLYEIETYLQWLQSWSSNIQLPDDAKSLLSYDSLTELYECYRNNPLDEELQKEEGKIKTSIKASKELFYQAETNGDLLHVQWASLANRILFKMAQAPHVAKHAAVDLVYLKRGKNGALHIHLLPAENDDRKAFSDTEQKIREKALSDIEREIRDEAKRALGVDAFREVIRTIRLFRHSNEQEQWTESEA